MILCSKKNLFMLCILCDLANRQPYCTLLCLKPLGIWLKNGPTINCGYTGVFSEKKLLEK